MRPENTIKTSELRSGLALSVVFFLRMFALFMLIPAIALTSNDLVDATPALIGVALGIHGLTQALFQIPLGMLSDKWGRKPVITAGLIFFILGSIVAGMAGSVWQLILGRALQGVGAISASIMALATDLSREQQRTKIMALIGASIGAAFVLAFIVGPVLYARLGYSMFFFFSALLAALALLGLSTLVPSPQRPGKYDSDCTIYHRLKGVMGNTRLNCFSCSIFISHLILMANFTALPLVLREYGRLEAGQHWQFYLPVILLSLFVVGPLFFLNKQAERTKKIMIAAMALFFVSQLGAAQFYSNYHALMVLMILFFIPFNYLEAYLPAQVSCVAPKAYKGAALGVYSVAQFIGIFVGGIAGGLLHDLFGIAAIHLACALLALLWGLLLLIKPDKKGAMHNHRRNT